MKIVLILYITITLLGYKIGVPPSEREIDEKDCTMWKYGEPETYEWCLEKPTPEIIREIE